MRVVTWISGRCKNVYIFTSTGKMFYKNLVNHGAFIKYCEWDPLEHENCLGYFSLRKKIFVKIFLVQYALMRSEKSFLRLVQTVKP